MPGANYQTHTQNLRSKDQCDTETASGTFDGDENSLDQVYVCTDAAVDDGTAVPFAGGQVASEDSRFYMATCKEEDKKGAELETHTVYGKLRPPEEADPLSGLREGCIGLSSASSGTYVRGGTVRGASAAEDLWRAVPADTKGLVDIILKLLRHNGEHTARQIRRRVARGQDATANGRVFSVSVLKTAIQVWDAAAEKS